MVKLLIIADDFTGALDTAVQFVNKGIETLVFTGKSVTEATVSVSAEVLVVDAETRRMTSKEAYTTVLTLVRQALEAGVKTIYKKTDSALRGNVGSELAAVLDGAEVNQLFFIPAFPALHRTTQNGIQYIDGVKLEESSFGEDPFDPMRCSYIPEILRRQTNKKVRLISTEKEIPVDRNEEKEILVFDAVTDEDIRKRVRELQKKHCLTFLAGCAGFASFLPEVLGLTGSHHDKLDKTDCLFVSCGSLNSITKEQILYAQKKGFYRSTLSPVQKLCPEYYKTTEGKEFLDRLADTCKKEQCVEVDSFDIDGQENTMDYAKRRGMDKNQIRFSVCASHGKIVHYLWKHKVNMTVLMTGGDTLMGFMEEIGINQISPVGELEKGVVLSKLDWNGKQLQVISKSGGFGEEATLVEIAKQVLKKPKKWLKDEKTGE